MLHLIQVRLALLLLVFIATSAPGGAQERVKIAYSSADASNTVWFTALDGGMYRKYGLDVELIFIQSSTMSVSTVVSGDIQMANSSGGAVASAAVGGANLVMTACYINTLPYELIVQESVKSVEDLKGKSVGISRVGSASDVAARVLIKGLGLEPVKDVPIIQVGGPTERAAAFRTGRIVGFPSPPGTIHLAKGMPHRIMISTADFQKRYRFSVHLLDDHEKLSGEPSRNHAAAHDGARRSDAFSQDPQRRDEKIYRQVHAPEQSPIFGGFLRRQRQAA